LTSKILIADTPEGSTKLNQILNGHDLTFAKTLSEARGKLEQPFDLVIAGLHFDDSRMFEFLRELKRSDCNATKPLILYCSKDTRMVRMMVESLRLISGAIGAWTFLDELAFATSSNPHAELRLIFERCLTGESPKEVGQNEILQTTSIAQNASLLNG